MRLWIRSDLHCIGIAEVIPAFDDPPPHDVAILAGDVSYGIRRTINAIDAVATGPVVYVAGNHEAYHRTLPHEIDQGLDASARAEHVRFLENRAWLHGDVRFLGATMWTDFGLYGQDARQIAMHHAKTHSSDFELIMAREQHPLSLNFRSHVFQPDDARRMFSETVAWLEDQFATPFDGPTVVVTHHAPARGSISREFRGDPMTPAYVSDLAAQIERWQPDLWIHGHTHRRFDYHIGRTRVVCNPRGIYGGVDAEESGYDPRLVVVI